MNALPPFLMSIIEDPLFNSSADGRPIHRRAKSPGTANTDGADITRWLAQGVQRDELWQRGRRENLAEHV